MRYTRTKHDMFEVGYFLGVFSPLMLVLEKTSRNPTPTTRSIPTQINAGLRIAQLLLFVVPGDTDSLHPLSYSVSSETEGFKVSAF